MYGAKLRGADLRGADLEGADLGEASDLTSDQVCESLTLYRAEMDPELEAQVKQQCPEKLEKPK